MGPAADAPALWRRHDREWRDPAQVASQWEDAARTEPGLLRARVKGAFWDAVDAADSCLLVSREYEHLLVALTVADGRPRTTFMRMPHPSGIAVDTAAGRVHVASTRNPNQLYELGPVRSAVPRGDASTPQLDDHPLVPVRSRFFPGSLYLHDLAFVGGTLHGNAVGQNAVVRFEEDGARRVWWPKSIEREGSPDVTRNYLQLNSIAAGPDIEQSFFSASAERPSSRRPGHLNFPVDRRGVIFSGGTREPMAGGLTRPHSARLHGDELWVDNSGYGEVGRVADGGFAAAARLPGWTRGLAFAGTTAFVGVSRVIPRFRAYAPGLDVDRSVCAVVALDTGSGRVLGSLAWPSGNQVFAVESAPRTLTLGFPFRAGRRQSAALRELFYSFSTDDPTED